MSYEFAVGGGYGGEGPVRNDPMHPSLYSLNRGTNRQPPLRWGRMIRRKRNTTEVEAQFNFVFNPDSYAISYSVSPHLLASDLGQEGGGANQIEAQTSVSFNLLVDRLPNMLEDPTYEGVTKDRLVFEKVFGGSETGLLRAEFVEIHFGGARAWTFTGVLLGAQTELSHFSYEMVPMRMALQLNLQRRDIVTYEGPLFGEDYALPKAYGL